MGRRILFMATFLMLFLGLIYAWSLFAAPMEEAFNWSRSQTSITFSISMITFCLGSIISGLVLKKRPPGNIILASAILFLIGFFTASRIRSIWGLYMSYGVLCGLGVGLSYNAILSTIPKWYPEKAGFVTGTLLMGMGLGSLLLGAVVKKVMDILIWPATFKILSIVFFSIFLLASFFIVNPKEEVATFENKVNQKDSPLIHTLRTKDFWAVFIWSVIVSSMGLAVVSNAAYMAIEVGVSLSSLPLMVGMVSIGNGLGRLIFGTISDRLGGNKAMALGNMVFLIALIFSLLAGKNNISLFIALGFIFAGMGYGASPTLSAALTKKKFGEKYYPQNLSAIVLALIPASIIGPTISAGVYQRFGSYLNVYYILMVFALLAFLPVKVYKED